MASLDGVTTMKTPSHVLSECQGTFEWGRHDCLSTIEALARQYQDDYKPIYSQWLALTEPQSWRVALKQYGSLLEGHRQHLVGAGLVETTPPIQPGDLVVASSKTLMVDGSEWDGRKGRDLILFVDDSCLYWYWGVDGLSPVTLGAEPSIVFRFPKLIKD